MTSLTGTWRLLDWVSEDETGAVDHPMGPSPEGVICYTDDGFVHVHIMAADRIPHIAPDTMAGSAEEDSRSAKSHISYSGRWRREGDQVIHDVTISSFPNWAPSRQVRDMRFVGANLELSAGPMEWGDKRIRHRLTWTRAT